MTNDYFNYNYKDVIAVKKNHADNPYLMPITESAVISFRKLETFLEELKSLKSSLGDQDKIYGIRIHVFREKKNEHKIYEDPGRELRWASDTFSQISFLLIPACYKEHIDNLDYSREFGADHGMNNDDFEDYTETDNNNEVRTYGVQPGGEVTGLCPPRCK